MRPAVTFGAAAESWESSEELRTNMLAAVDHLGAPVLLLHASNDYSVAPGHVLAVEPGRLGKPCVLTI